MFLLGCSKHSIKKEDPISLFNKAKKSYIEKHYSKAISLFNKYVIEYPLSDSADIAQFLLANAYYEKKNFERAKQEFDFLLHQYSLSSYKEEAEFKAAVCAYQKKPYYQRDLKSLNSIRKRFHAFIIDYPSSKFKNKFQSLTVLIPHLLSFAV